MLPWRSPRRLQDAKAKLAVAVALPPARPPMAPPLKQRGVSRMGAALCGRTTLTNCRGMQCGECLCAVLVRAAKVRVEAEKRSSPLKPTTVGQADSAANYKRSAHQGTKFCLFFFIGLPSCASQSRQPLYRMPQNQIRTCAMEHTTTR